MYKTWKWWNAQNINVSFYIKNAIPCFRPKNRVPWYPLESKKRPTRRLGKHKLSKSAIYLTFWGFLGFRDFSLFSHFHFLIFDIFHFFTFLILSLFTFSRFSCFCWFSHFLDFWWFSLFSSFFIVFQFLKGYLKDKALFWPLFGPNVHSHGKHFEGVNS